MKREEQKMKFSTNSKKILFLVTMGLIGLIVQGLFAAVPNRINFQGKLLDSSKNPRNGTFSMTFRICDTLAASCASPIWNETQGSVSVSNGVFSVQLGDSSSLTESVFSSDSRYLEIEIGGETLSPRERLITSPYAYRAATADALDNGSATYIENTATLQSGSTFYVSSGTVNGNLTVGGVIKAGSGAIAITTAGGQLDVNQLSGSISNSSLDSSSVTKQGNQFNGASQLVQLNSSSGLDLSGTIIFSGVTKDITTASGEDLVIDPAGNGDVGIGITTPTGKLHVSSSNAVAGDSVLVVSSGTTAAQELMAVKGDGIVEVAGAVAASNYLIQVYDNTGGTAFGTAFVSIPWDSQTFVDSIFSHDTGVNNSQVTVNRTGLYRITYNINADEAPNNSRTIGEFRCYKNGNTEITPSRTFSYNRQNTAGEGTGNATFLANLNNGDYIEIQGQRIGGGDFTMTGGTQASWLMVEFIR